MDPRSLPPLQLLLFSLALLQTLWVSHASSTSPVRCPAAERAALMDIKQQLRDPSRRLSSWVGRDCCAWEGVACSNTTGHVVQLDFRNRHRLSSLGDCSDETSEYWRSDDEYGCRWALLGGISPSLLSLRHLRHLDLSGNFFQHNLIPDFFGSLSRLKYLNLSAAGFKGKVPDELGNLSNLHHLDLSFNVLTDDEDSAKYHISPCLYTENAGWISQLTSLRELNMNWVSLKNASKWLGTMNSLPYIQELRLSNCEIVSLFPPHNLPLYVNFTFLTTLDLSDNYINSSVPVWLFNITSLEQLDLGGNYLNWPDLASISKLTSLRVLDLSDNVLQHGLMPTWSFCSLCNLQTLILEDVNINEEIMNLQPVFSGCLRLSLEELYLSSTGLKGYLSDWLWSMNNLKYLDLSGNTLCGPLPASFGNLSSLRSLDVTNNQLNGTIVEGTFRHMKELVDLSLGGNSLILDDLANLSSSLKILDISTNTLVLKENYEDWIPPFQLEYLYMFSCRILDKSQFPKWLPTQRILFKLDLSSMGIKDTFPNWLPASLEFLDLSNNEIIGHVPQYLPNLQYLNLSNNSLSGQLPLVPQLFLKILYLDLSNNFLSGPLPFYINNMLPFIKYLDLSMNDFTGRIPFSICQIKPLVELQLSKNNFSESIPNCWDNSTKIVFLDLSMNNLKGEIPKSLCNLQRLQLLNLSHNNLSGQISSYLKYCTRLIVLNLSYNHFCGNIPIWISENLLHLHILILRSNNFIGNISSQLFSLEYLQILDLSNNNLSGYVPSSFGKFSALKRDSVNYASNISLFISMGLHLYILPYFHRTWLFIKGSELGYHHMLSYPRNLDLSNNSLTGYIPRELGNLSNLQSLNLSYNYLIGEIPQNIDGMQKLEVLDLSRNNLSGLIPSSLASLNFLRTLDLSYNNLSGQIPTGNQLRTFDQSKYAGNANLCGFPLSKSCANDIAKGDEEAQKEDTTYKIEIILVFASIALGFIIGFWTICGVLISKRRWRFSFFRVVDNMQDKLYMMMMVNLKRLRRE